MPCQTRPDCTYARLTQSQPTMKKWSPTMNERVRNTCRVQVVVKDRLRKPVVPQRAEPRQVGQRKPPHHHQSPGVTVTPAKSPRRLPQADRLVALEQAWRAAERAVEHLAAARGHFV